jgi:hypothetical protein
VSGTVLKKADLIGLTAFDIVFHTRPLISKRFEKGTHMTIREFYRKIDRMPENTRMERINQLLRLLSPLSIDSLRRFKKGWQGGSHEQFIFQRDKEIKGCIDWEFSVVGISTRAIQGLPYLDWDTELNIDAKIYNAKTVSSKAS